MTSTSTPWESRNRGFIPPSQLRQFSTTADDLNQQQQEHQHQQSQPRPSPQPTVQQARPMSLATSSPRPVTVPTSSTSNHTRSSSFFSFRSKSSNTSSSTAPRKLTRPRSPLAGKQPTLPKLDPPPSLDANPASHPPQSQSQTGEQSPDAPPLHPEIRSIVGLTMAHTQKIYFSGPLVRRLERQSDGQRPTNDPGWRDVWVQLYGTTLSIWDMMEVKEASEQGKEVPPSYVNVTEAFIQVLGAITQPATAAGPAQKFSNVITLNTAGSNLILLSCPTTADLISWAAALRLATWEKSRLEEMYTAHLIRITLNDGRNTPTPLVHGRMEGWVRVRIAGQTDWKRLWMVVTSGLQPSSPPRTSSDVTSIHSNLQRSTPRKNRVSGLFSRDHGPEQPEKSMLTLYTSPKAKDKKTPILSLMAVTQAFSVYPERPKLISTSTLMKLEGTYGQEEMAGSMRFREGWMLFMPDLEGTRNPGGEMLKWLIGIHDAFELYGRPKGYVWDPRDSVSMMFAYPIGPNKDLLFLDREFAEALDPREDRTSVIRAKLLNIIVQRMHGIPVPSGPPQAQGVPQANGGHGAKEPPQIHETGDTLPQLPPFAFDATAPDRPEGPPAVPEKGTLTPISDPSAKSSTLDKHTAHLKPSTVVAPLSRVAQEKDAAPDKPISTIPTSVMESSDSRNGMGSGRVVTGSRQDSKSDHLINSRPTDSTSTGSVEPSNAAFPASLSPGHLAASPEVGHTTSISVDQSNSQSNISTSPHHKHQHSTHASTENQATSRLVPRSGSPVSSITSRMAQAKSPFEPVLSNPNPLQQKTPMSPPSSSPPAMQPPQPITVLSPGPLSPPLPPALQSTQVPASHSMNDHDISGALYYMQELQQDSAVPTNTRQPPNHDSGSEESTYSSSPNALSPLPQPIPLRPQKKPLLARNGSMTQSISNVDRSVSGSKPLGARDRVNRPNQEPRRSGSDDVANAQRMSKVDRQRTSHEESYDDNADALAALTFLEAEDSRKIPQPASEDSRAPPAPPVHISPPPAEDPDDPSENSVDGHYKSSFAPSKKAAERLAKSQAQQAAHQAAALKPGRSNSRPKAKAHGTWNESSDEEEDDGDDDDDDVDSDGGQVAPLRSVGHDHGSFAGPGRSGGNGRQPLSYDSMTDMAGLHPQRPPRHLPQPPAGHTYGAPEGYYQNNTPRRHVPNQHSDGGRAQFIDEGSRRASPQPNLRSQAEYPTPGAAHQSMWSQVLEPGRATPERDLFVQIEPPSQTMTKAFAPHGLLSAGLQDKQGRSAKRQEELAKETGASLVNVPTKPPPPQTGLLGAVSAHERERKREGGIGAALTERERDRRLAEERQRKLDEFQRQQLEMAQTGSMYGVPGSQFNGFNPMMANPMMMGMNPMMTGWGYPAMNPMMAGFGTPQQQMFAAQQAAQQAYQQAMMAYSQAGGSQVGDMQGMQMPAMNQMQPLNPMMTGGSMFDPRMSMMMAGQMGQMGPMGMLGMPQVGGMSPLGMQTTGGSGFDPRFSTFNMDAGGHQRTNSSSPGPQGSPAGPQPIDQPPRSPADGSPNPQSRL